MNSPTHGRLARSSKAGKMFGAVDTASWTASLKEAVLLYIEGL
jgi:hypothetical protein